MQQTRTIHCTKCNTIYTVHEEGMRFPWIDKEEYRCPVCGEYGGFMKTHYNLKEAIVSYENTIEPYKSHIEVVLTYFDKLNLL